MKNNFIDKEINERVNESGDFDIISSKIKIQTINHNIYKKSRRPIYFKIVGTLATFILVVVSAYLLSNLNFSTSSGGMLTSNNSSIASEGQRWEIVYEEAVEDRTTNDSYILHWDEKSIIQQYSDFIYNNLRYSIFSTQTSKPVPDEYVGDMIDVVTLLGYDVYENITHEINASVYKIKKINQDCALVIQYEDDLNYYAFVNEFYKFETLGDLLFKLNLSEYGIFGTANYDYDDKNGHHLIRFDDFDDSIVWNKLLFDETKENVFLSNNQEMHDNYITIRISIPALGIINNNAAWIAINDKGLLKIHILRGNDSQSIFNIGEDNTSAFANYIFDNIKGYEIVYIKHGDLPAGDSEGNSSLQTSSGVGPEYYGERGL